MLFFKPSRTFNSRYSKRQLTGRINKLIIENATAQPSEKGGLLSRVKIIDYNTIEIATTSV